MVVVDGHSLNLESFIQVVRFNEEVKLNSDAVSKINASRKIVQDIVENDRVVYGITTGFGKLANITVDKKDVMDLQKNLIMSHACGVGEVYSDEVVRGIMLLRINALSKGFSGIRLETIEKLVEYLNLRIHPVIPSQGSLGASGDLAPLSHMALPLIGLGRVRYEGEIYDTMDLLNRLNISPLTHLDAKEGLALINGTQAMTSVGAITLYDALHLSSMADIIAALTMEAYQGIDSAFFHKVHALRPHPGQIDTAKNILSIVSGSDSISHQGVIRVQDPYTIRCIPQIHGASKDAFQHILQKLEIEMNSVTDNPLIFEDEVISAGNFHGQAMALPFDYLGIAISELANVSERRLERLVNPALSDGLPPFLIENSGLNSGFMIVQYSAASLVSENKVYAHPASVDSIPSSANQEDHVSMGTTSARKANMILKNAQKVLAMEYFAAAQAVDLRKVQTLGQGTQLAYDLIRKHVDYITDDVVMNDYINKVVSLVETNQLSQLVSEHGIIKVV